MQKQNIAYQQYTNSTILSKYVWEFKNKSQSISKKREKENERSRIRNFSHFHLPHTSLHPSGEVDAFLSLKVRKSLSN